MRVLVTGGCGFVGSNVASAALARGDEVLVIDGLLRHGSGSNLQWLRNQGLRNFLHMDVRNRAELLAAVAEFRPDAVAHLAGQVAMTTSVADPYGDFTTNAMGTVNLLDAVRLGAPEAAVVYSSSNKVYGDFSAIAFEETATRYVCPAHPLGFDERLPLDFRTPYGCSKGTADQYMLDYARIFGLRTTVLRHSSMYGGRQFATFDQGWVGWFVAEALAARRTDGLYRPEIAGDGKQVRDLLHARDVARLYLRLFDAPATAVGRAFNVGGGIENSLSLLELFNILETELGIRIEPICGPWRMQDQIVFVADSRAVQAATGWSPQVGKREGVISCIDWLQSADGSATPAG